jgi:hypothetical protein
MMWGEFREMVTRKFVPMNEQERVKNEFLNLRMTGSDIKSYNSKFFAYSRLVAHLVTPESNQISVYIWGLVKEIRDMVRASMPQTMDSAVELARLLTYGMVRTQEESRKKEVVPKANPEARRFDKGNERREGRYDIPRCKTCGKSMPGDAD